MKCYFIFLISVAGDANCEADCKGDCFVAYSNRCAAPMSRREFIALVVVLSFFGFMIMIAIIFKRCTSFQEPVETTAQESMPSVDVSVRSYTSLPSSSSVLVDNSTPEPTAIDCSLINTSCELSRSPANV